jgi:hypothetical protein
MKGYSKAGPRETCAIRDALTPLLKIIEKDKSCEYVAGASDATVAKSLGLSVNQVAHVRKDCFGMLRMSPPTKPASAIETLEHAINNKLATLQTSIELLGLELQETGTAMLRVIEAHNKLCDEIALNKVWQPANRHKLPPLEQLKNSSATLTLR